MAIPALVVLAGDGSAKQKEYAANALGNLAADPALLERVVTPQNRPCANTLLTQRAQVRESAGHSEKVRITDVRVRQSL